MKRSFLKKEKGFSLTELLVVLAMLVLVFEIVYTAYFLSRKGYSEGETRAEITQNGRVVLERMTREIRQTKDVVTELSDDSAQATSTLEFEDGHATTSYHYIRYWQEGNTIKREVKRYYFPSDPDVFVSWNTTSPTESLQATTTEGPVVIGEFIQQPDGLKFWGSFNIHISLTVAKDDESVDFSTTIYGRNL